VLGYQFARETMDRLGYGELVFDDHHFKNELQFCDAVPMFHACWRWRSRAGCGSASN
jgi:putative selenate reductase